MKKTLLLALFLFLLSGCGEKNAKPLDWGSFTAEKTYSYDGRFYAVQTVESEEGLPARYILVSIYSAEDDTFLFSFSPARARDFWGICWETDTYNIWTQSADIGIYCYQYEDGQWILNPSAVRPDDIRSKYDD